MNRNVDGKEMLKAMKKKVIPLMKRTGSNVLFHDGCGPGHDKIVNDELHKNGIFLYPKASQTE